MAATIALSPLLCLALTVYHEGRSEPLHAQYAIAHVGFNRAHRTPSKVCDEIFRKGQFAWTGGKSRKHYAKVAKSLEDDKAFQKALFVVGNVINRRHRDTTNGATHFHLKTVKPAWDWKKLQPRGRFGLHVFYADPKVVYKLPQHRIPS